jgi:hypothetical protein
MQNKDKWLKWDEFLQALHREQRQRREEKLADEKEEFLAEVAAERWRDEQRMREEESHE